MLEEVIGFDAALMVQDSVFWALHGFATPPGGAVILSSWWPSLIVREKLKKKSPPSFRLNLFLQHKRPEYLHKAQAKEWKKWYKPYYRFWTTPHQQTALEACASGLGAHGLVAYACPAFHTRADLFKHIEKQTLRANTHFAPVSRLAGHGRYTYVDALRKGKAHSKVEEVEPLVFLSGRGGDSPPREPPGGGDSPPREPPGGGDSPPREPPGGGDGRSPEDLLADAHRAAEAAIRASPVLVGGVDAHRRAVRRATAMLPPELPRANGPPVRREDGSVQNFLFASTFSSMSRVAWVVLA